MGKEYEREKERGASQPKLRLEKHGLKQKQGGLSSLGEKMRSCSGDKKVVETNTGGWLMAASANRRQLMATAEDNDGQRWTTTKLAK